VVELLLLLLLMLGVPDFLFLLPAHYDTAR
jgi:hypothetical protein